MKIDCEIVKDLLVVYKDNEISETVKNRVDKHLDECDLCRNFYDSEKSFDELFKKSDIDLPEETDKKILRNIKIKRLQFAVICISILLLVIVVSNYRKSRSNILNIMELIQFDVSYLTRLDDYTNENNTEELTYAIRKINESDFLLNGQLNYFEKKQTRSLNNQIQSNHILNLVKILQLRKTEGAFNEKDKEVIKRLNQYTKGYQTEFCNSINHFRKLRENLGLEIFYFLDYSKLSNYVSKINELSAIYPRYNKLPEELKPLDDKTLSIKIKTALNIRKNKVVLNKQPFNPTYIGFEEQTNSSSLRTGEIDIFTGDIINVASLVCDDSIEKYSRNKKSSKEEYIKEFITNLYHIDEQDIIVKDMVNTNGQDFITLKKDGYKIFDKLSINLTDGILYSFSGFHYPDMFPIKVDTNILVNKDDSYLKLKDYVLKSENYTYVDTLIIKSSLSMKYVLVHAYGISYNGEYNDYENIYINALTGKREYKLNSY